MYDVVIIGGGISGGSAALYTSMGKLKTAVLDTGQSQIKKVSTVFNFPGIQKISGDDLIATIEQQAKKSGTRWIDDEVVKIEREAETYKIHTTSGTVVKSIYVVIATNLNVTLLTQLGFELAVNEKVPSGKIKKVINLQPDGQTDMENLYVTGLLAGIPSQAVVAAGHGTKVGIDIVSKETGKTYMWHDI